MPLNRNINWICVQVNVQRLHVRLVHQALVHHAHVCTSLSLDEMLCWLIRQPRAIEPRMYSRRQDLDRAARPFKLAPDKHPNVNLKVKGTQNQVNECSLYLACALLTTTLSHTANLPQIAAIILT